MRPHRAAAPAAAGLLYYTQLVGAFAVLPGGIMEAYIAPRAGAQCPTDSTLQQCGQDFPSSFCCPSGQQCVSIDNGNGALCCPPGHTCSTIDAVPGACQESAYNATLAPSSPVHLVNIPTSFTPCNGTSNCCPPGFDCNNNICVQQGSSPSSASASAAATSAVSLVSAHSSPTATPDTSTSASSASTVSNSTASDSSDSFPPVAVLVGFFPGVLAGSLISLLLVMWLGKRRKQRNIALSGSNKHSGSQSSLGPVRAHISDPIYQEDAAGRVEFLHRNQHLSRTPSSASPESHRSPALRSPGLRRIRSLFNASTPAQSPRGLGVGASSPRTPVQDLRREPSTESIKIFSPPEIRGEGAGGGSRNTTYSDVMRAVGASPPREHMPPRYEASSGRRI